MRSRKSRSKRARRPRYQTTIERLEDRALLTASWNNFGGNAQHTDLAQVAAQPLNQLLWSTPLDLAPWGTVHYGDPVFTPGNTVIVPIKITWSAQDQNEQNFYIAGLNDVTGAVEWTSAVTGSVTGASNAGPIVITTGTTTGLTSGDSVTVGGVNGNTAANGAFTITVLNSTQFQLNGTTGNGAYTSGGTWAFNPNGASYIAPTYNWLAPLQPVYDPVNDRVYFPGPGGTLDYIAHPDNPGSSTPTVVQEAFYGLSNYTANESAYNASIYTDTGLLVDGSGNVYFGFTETGTNPSGINDGGFVRITPTGTATYTLAYAAVGQTNDGNWNPSLGQSPTLSNDGSTVYIGVDDSGYSLNFSNESKSYLVALNSTTMAAQDSVRLIDPATGAGAVLIDESSASPMVAPDNTVFMGVFSSNYNGSRGFLLHYSSNLATEYTPGAFGWDDTPSIVPTSMVPSYTGTSSYLILSKYNNYANTEVGQPYGGNGVNQIAILDPYASQLDPNYDANPNLQVMKQVMAMTSVSPDIPNATAGDPNAVREWCTNGSVVDPATDSVYVNNEDGYTYQWNLGTGLITNAVQITSGIGVPYTPTAIAPNGEIYSDNGGTLFALGGYSNYTMSTVSSANPAVVGTTVTLTTTLASTNNGATPTGTVTYSYFQGANNPLNYNTTPVTIGTAPVVNGVASIQVSGLAAAHYHIYASYSGDSNYSSGQTILVQPVLETATTTITTSSTNPANAGTSVTFTVTVAPNGTTFVPIGTVTFMDGSTVLGTASLNNLENETNPPSTNTATFTTSSLPGGTDAITAVYSGDQNFTTGTSAVFNEYIPAVTNPGTQNGAVDDTASLQVQASGLPTGDSWTFSATGLPSGLSINTSTGAITGTITGSASTYSASVTAADGTKASASQTFTWKVSTLSVTNPGTQNSAVGDSVSLQTQDSGLPSGDSWSYSATGLPSGLSIDPVLGLITGTITGSVNTYSASVTASDGQGASASQTFTWNVSALSVTNPGTQNNAVGDAVSLQVQDSGLPAGDSWSYSATGLPSGLAINPTSGLITGTATGSANTYSSSVTARDGQGASASQTFTWNVSVLSEANPGTQNNAVGDSVSLQIQDSGLPSGDSWSYSATGLPTGLSINPTSGLITGTVTGAANTYSASVSASDGQGGSVSQSFSWNVSALSETNPGTQTNGVGDNVSLQIQDSGLPSGDTWSYSATGLPSGLSISPTSGLISGTITGSPNTYSASVTASDGHGASASQSFTWNVFDRPAISGPSSASLTENTSLTFSSASGNQITVADGSAGSNADSLTVSVSNGTVTLGSTTGLTFTNGGNGTASFTVSGTIGNLTVGLNGLTYQPNFNYIGSDSIAISLTDTVDTLAGSTSVALTVNAITPPSIAAPSTATVSENGSLVFSPGNSNAISISDNGAGGNADTATLSVANGILTLGSTTGLIFTSGSNGSASFTVKGTVSNLNTALNGLNYQPTNGYAGSDSLSISVVDPTDNKSGSNSVAITVSPFAPSITAPASASLNQNGSLVFSGGNAISVTDANPGAVDSLSLSVTHGTLTLSTTSGLTFTSGSNGTASFTVSGTVGNLNAALSGLTYTPTAGYTGSDSLAISVTDPGDSLSASKNVSLTINALAPPTVTAPASATLLQNSSLVFSSSNGNAITVADAAAGGNSDSLTLSVTHGTLTLATISGLTFTTGNNGSASFTVTGTVANLNAALNGLTYQPTANYTGSDSLAISITDPRDNESASKTVALTINAFSPPSISAPGSAAVVLNGSLVFSSANSNAITVADTGPGNGSDRLTLTVTHGTVTLSTTSGLTITGGANGSATVTVTGSIARLNAALSGLVYTPTSGYTGSDSLAISLNDTADNLSASANVALTVSNSAPAITAPATASLPSRTSTLVFSTANNNAISITDVNAGSAAEPLTLTATNGTLNLGSTTGITITAGANGSASMTISGTLAALNGALSGLTFVPISAGKATIVLSYTDVGTGLKASATINITIAKVTGGGGGGGGGPVLRSPGSANSAAIADQTTASDAPMPPDAMTQWQGLAAAVEMLNG